MFGIEKKNIVLIMIGTFIVSFGLYNIHEQFFISEGGVLGAMLLIHHWTGIPVSLISFVLDGLCYLLAFKYLGLDFIKKSLVASIFTLMFLAILEMYPPLIPLSFSNPWLQAIVGGLFIGVGVGIVIRYGGSCGGDDALALIISQKFNLPLRFSYLSTDITVLLLSLSYISFAQIKYSLVTVVISSVIIDRVNNYRKGNAYENKTI